MYLTASFCIHNKIFAKTYISLEKSNLFNFFCFCFSLSLSGPERCSFNDLQLCLSLFSQRLPSWQQRLENVPYSEKITFSKLIGKENFSERKFEEMLLFPQISWLKNKISKKEWFCRLKSTDNDDFNIFKSL